MRFLVCFKVVGDLDSVTANEWASALMPDPDLSFTKRIYSPFDESALETALRLRDAVREQGGDAHLTAMSLCRAGEDLDRFTTNLYATGYDEVHVLRHGADLRFQPAASAGILADAIMGLRGFDLILFGCQAGVGDSRQIPIRVAYALGFPIIPLVHCIRYCDGMFTITSQTDPGRKISILAPPFAVTMGNAEASYLRVATLREKLAASGHAVMEQVVETHPSRQDPRLNSLHRPIDDRTPVLLQGDDACDLAHRLYTGWLLDRLEDRT